MNSIKSLYKYFLMVKPEKPTKKLWLVVASNLYYFLKEVKINRLFIQANTKRLL